MRRFLGRALHHFGREYSIIRPGGTYALSAVAFAPHCMRVFSRVVRERNPTIVVVDLRGDPENRAGERLRLLSEDIAIVYFGRNDQALRQAFVSWLGGSAYTLGGYDGDTKGQVPGMAIVARSQVSEQLVRATLACRAERRSAREMREAADEAVQLEWSPRPAPLLQAAAPSPVRNLPPRWLSSCVRALEEVELMASELPWARRGPGWRAKDRITLADGTLVVDLSGVSGDESSALVSLLARQYFPSGRVRLDCGASWYVAAESKILAAKQAVACISAGPIVRVVEEGPAHLTLHFEQPDDRALPRGDGYRAAATDPTHRAGQTRPELRAFNDLEADGPPAKSPRWLTRVCNDLAEVEFMAHELRPDAGSDAWRARSHVRWVRQAMLISLAGLGPDETRAIVNVLRVANVPSGNIRFECGYLGPAASLTWLINHVEALPFPSIREARIEVLDATPTSVTVRCLQFDDDDVRVDLHNVRWAVTSIEAEASNLPWAQPRQSWVSAGNVFLEEQKVTVDLHGLTSGLVESLLLSLHETSLRTPTIRLIVGLGNHSIVQPVLRNCVLRVLEEVGATWFAPSWGTVVAEQGGHVDVEFSENPRYSQNLWRAHRNRPRDDGGT